MPSFFRGFCFAPCGRNLPQTPTTPQVVTGPAANANSTLVYDHSSKAWRSPHAQSVVQQGANVSPGLRTVRPAETIGIISVEPTYFSSSLSARGRPVPAPLEVACAPKPVVQKSSVRIVTKKR
eukprot:gnl/MRDRNA2_/MRDRNA2_118786_c0_seq1.p2 gnl/MRDRNA2_/MRDRNA2_118786_c0~~gnl/MRDRNA2_/MRDRNA2_118786_c0_seq1.p2  ORF type:complete len:123 (-),score=8.34 gnl/MRDRNA2_/MRDRNA2_118786_c0_seq1:31-399(-)